MSTAHTHRPPGRGSGGVLLLRHTLLLFIAALALLFCRQPAHAQVLNTLYDFTPYPGPGGPQIQMIQASDGHLYGAGLDDVTSIYAATTSGIVTSIYTFTNGADGNHVSDKLLQGQDGALYGTCLYAGAGNGTIFRITTDGTAANTSLTPIWEFSGGSDGGGPYAGLVQLSNGVFYGTANGGGAYGNGVIFSLTTDGTAAGTTLTPIYSFPDDAGLIAALTPGNDGNLYGMTLRGGDYSVGSVFCVTPSGAYTDLYSFTSGTDGANPYGSLLLASDGNFYGTTSEGGDYGYGGIFQLATDGTEEDTLCSPLWSFTGGADGANPNGGLVQSSPGGPLFGTAPGGGLNWSGSLFSITTDGSFTPLYSFSALEHYYYNADGAYPNAALTAGSDGNLYGIAGGGGTVGDGTLFQYTLPAVTVTVTPTAGANGAISPSTPQTVNYGSSVTFTATPSTGYVVGNWTVDGTQAQAGGSSFTLSNITANHTVNVTFGSAVTVKVEATSGVHGTISPSGTIEVPSGNSITFTSTPNTGYLVRHWRVDGVIQPGYDGATSFTLSNITTHHTVHVGYKRQEFTVTASAGQYGAIDGDPTRTVKYGDSVNFTANPQARSTVDTWYVDGQAAQTGGNTFTMTNVTANHAVNVTFTTPWIKVNATSGDNGTISPSGDQQVAPGGSITFTATPNPGYVVNAWSVEGTAVQLGGNTFTLSNVTADCHVTVNYARMTFVLTPSAGANGAISPAAAQTVNYGDSKTYTAKPAKGHTVGVWQVDGQTVQTGGTTLTLTNITASHSISVTFN